MLNIENNCLFMYVYVFVFGHTFIWTVNVKTWNLAELNTLVAVWHQACVRALKQTAIDLDVLWLYTSTHECHTHVDLIGSTPRFFCMHPHRQCILVTGSVSQGIKNTMDETYPSGSLHSVTVSCHWFPLQPGSHPLLWPAGWPLVPF